MCFENTTFCERIRVGADSARRNLVFLCTLAIYQAQWSKKNRRLKILHVFWNKVVTMAKYATKRWPDLLGSFKVEYEQLGHDWWLEMKPRDECNASVPLLQRPEFFTQLSYNIYIHRALLCIVVTFFRFCENMWKKIFRGLFSLTMDVRWIIHVVNERLQKLLSQPTIIWGHTSAFWMGDS